MDASQVTYKDWTVEKVRKVLKKLLKNRFSAWEKSDFLVQSKLQSWDQFKINFEAAQSWNLRGHFLLISKQISLLKNIIPGKSSVNQPMREEVKQLIIDSFECLGVPPPEIE